MSSLEKRIDYYFQILKPYWWVLIPIVLVCGSLVTVTALTCNLFNQPAVAQTPTLNPANTIPPTRTTLPTGQIPTILPAVTFPPTQVAIQPTFVWPTAVTLPTNVIFFTATPFPTAIPTSTPLPPPDVVIYSPANNNILAGIIQVVGSATSPFFLQYQLEFSPDPGDLWGFIPGSASTIQVQNGLLGLWDTRQTSDGFYQLRLRVFLTDGSSIVYVIRGLRISNSAPTPLPSATPIPLPTMTPTSTFTALPTLTPLPTLTATEIPSVTPEPTATIAIPPTDTLTPMPPLVDLNGIPVVPVLSPGSIANMRTIFDYGVNALGNRPAVFVNFGDGNTASPAYLTGFGDGSYNLDVYSGLQSVLTFFGSTILWEEGGVPRNSFNATSFAAASGWTTADLLDPARANPYVCQAGESPIQCEIRLTRPSIALIMIGTHDQLFLTPDAFQANLQTIVNTVLSNGVIPVLSTIPERLDGSITSEQTQLFNTIIVNVATASSAPLWNFWSAIRDLANRGLSADGVSLSQPDATFPTDLSGYGLQFGFNQRNLTALQVLDAIHQQIFPEVLPPAPTPLPTETIVPPTEIPTDIPTEIPTEAPFPTDIPTETPWPTEIPTETPLPTDIPTETPWPTEIPTETPFPTEIPTETPWPTETPTETPWPTEIPTEIPTEVPTETPWPTEIPSPSIDLNQIPVLPDLINNPTVLNNMQAIYTNGQMMGRNSGVFAQAGDVLPTDSAFLKEMVPGQIQWDVYQGSLEPVWSAFQTPVEGGTSFTRISVAANPTWTLGNLLDPAWADQNQCAPGETPLECEIRITQPAYMFVSTGRHETDPFLYQQNLNMVLQTITAAGVVPMLVTLPGDAYSTEPINIAMVEVAEMWNLPVWNLWLALRDLPGAGVNPDGTLTVGGYGQSAIFTFDQLQYYGANQANLSAMQILQILDDQLVP